PAAHGERELALDGFGIDHLAALHAGRWLEGEGRRDEKGVAREVGVHVPAGGDRGLDARLLLLHDEPRAHDVFRRRRDVRHGEQRHPERYGKGRPAHPGPRQRSGNTLAARGGGGSAESACVRGTHSTIWSPWPGSP